MISKHYEMRRLQMIAKYSVGQEVLDVGYAALPNPYLNSFHTVGYDRMETPVGGKYDEHVTGDIDDIQFHLENRQFDTIICGELIEHLENPYQFLRDVGPLLSPNGRLIITTPNPFGFPVFFAELFRMKSFYYAKDHTYYFLPRWVNRLLYKTGYKLRLIKGVGLWLPMLVFPFAPVILSYQVLYVADIKRSS